MSADISFDRWEILQLVRDTASELGIKEREISVLEAHLTVLPKGRIHPNDLIMSFAKLENLLDRANCMDERRFRRGETRLEALGLIKRKRSANARRFPLRDAKGKIKDAFGIDLKPLFQRVAQLQILRQTIFQQRADLAAAKSLVRARLANARRNGTTTKQNQLEKMAAKIRNLFRRASCTIHDVTEIDKELAKIEANFAERENPSHSVAPDTTTVKDGQTVRHIDTKRIYTKRNNLSDTANDDPEPIQWYLLKNITVFFPDRPQSYRELLDLLHTACLILGVHKHILEKIKSKVSIFSLLRCIDQMMGQGDQIREPNSYFVSITSQLRC